MLLAPLPADRALADADECLYDINSKSYCDKWSKQNAWEKISKDMGIPAEQCAQKWKRLRDNFRKALKNREHRSGDKASKRRPLKYEKELTFLKRFMQEHDQISNLSSPNREEPMQSRGSDDTTTNSLNIQDMDSSQGSDVMPTLQINTDASPMPTLPTSTAPSRASSSRHITSPKSVSDVLQNYIESKAKEEKDPIEMFFSAMASNVKKLPKILQLEVRQKVFNVVNDAEMKWMNESNLDNYSMFGGYYTDSYLSSTNYQSAPYGSSGQPVSNTRATSATNSPADIQNSPTKNRQVDDNPNAE